MHGLIVLIWNRHPTLKRKFVQEPFQAHKRLIRFEFPEATPDINPAEYIWAQVKEQIAGTVPHTIQVNHNCLTGFTQNAAFSA